MPCLSILTALPRTGVWQAGDVLLHRPPGNANAICLFPRLQLYNRILSSCLALFKLVLMTSKLHLSILEHSLTPFLLVSLLSPSGALNSPQIFSS